MILAYLHRREHQNSVHEKLLYLQKIRESSPRQSLSLGVERNWGPDDAIFRWLSVLWKKQVGPGGWAHSEILSNIRIGLHAISREVGLFAAKRERLRLPP